MAEKRRAKVLFVCVGNSCRSQMAEALARHSAADVIEPASAGVRPLGSIAAPTAEVLAERGVSVDGQYSKGLRRSDCADAHLIINLTGQRGDLLFPECAEKVEDWEIPDPYGFDLDLYRQVCDEIEVRLAALAERLRQKPEKGPNG